MRRRFTPTRKRPRFHQPSLRREVVTAARVLLERDGGAGLSLRAVARATGVFPTAVSHHFGDREGLLAALAEEGFAELNAALTAATSVRAMLDAYLALACAHPRLFALMFSPWSAFQRAHPQLAASGGKAFDLLRDAVARGAPAGTDATLIAQTLWCTVHGLATLRIEERAGKGRSRLDPDAILGAALGER